MSGLRLYIRSMILQVRSSQQYRFNYFLTIFTVVFHYAVQLFAIWLTLSHYDNIRGWNIYEISFIYMFFVLSYGIMITFFAGFRDFSVFVRNGDFDILLVRPHSTLFQVLCGRLELTSIAQIASGIVLFVWCNYHLHIEWSLKNIFLLIQGIVGASIIQASLLLFWSSLSFWIVDTSALVRFGWTLNSNYLTYPIEVFNKTAKWIFTVFPIAFISYYPANAILNKDENGFGFIGQFTILPSILFFALVFLFWLYSIRHYNSTGN
ncbi:ABC transporter permease [Paenibacillus sp. 2KB_22]